MQAPISLQDTWIAYYDTFIIHNIMGPQAHSFVARIQAAGKKATFQVSDLYNDKMYLVCDYITVTSRYFGDLLASQFGDHKVRVIMDAWENPDDVIKREYVQSRGTPSAVWFGCANSNYFYARDKVVPLLHHAGWDSYFITIHDTADMQYDHKTVYQALVKHDICFIPSVLLEEHKCKSPNRVVQSMVLGLPIICSPVPDYIPVVRTFRNGYVAYSQQDWITYLIALKDQTTRERIGK